VPFDELSDTLYDVPEGGEPGGKPAYETYLDSRFADRKASLIETPFSLEVSDAYRVRGRIDAVYADGGLWEIVDFKSGRPKADPSRIVQLQAYAIAAKRIDFGIDPPRDLKVTFAYLGDGLEEVVYQADEKWMADASDSLDALTSRMADGDYTEHPGKWCRNCDFLRFCRPGQEEVSS
jgi:predicted RecB family nuclease